MRTMMSLNPLFMDQYRRLKHGVMTSIIVDKKRLKAQYYKFIRAMI